MIINTHTRTHARMHTHTHAPCGIAMVTEHHHGNLAAPRQQNNTVATEQRCGNRPGHRTAPSQPYLTIAGVPPCVVCGGGCGARGI